MKNLLYLFLLSPFMVFAQPGSELIFEIATHTVSRDNAAQVEHAMGEHNKKYHASGPNGVRVYTVQTGPGSGSYKWIMGPGPWSALDTRPSDDAHNADWDGNVARYLGEEGNTEYVSLDRSLSRFPNDFNVDKLFVRYVDVARGKMEQVKEIIKKITRVYTEKIPNETYGVYFSEIPSTSSGRDITIISFFDKYAWMAQDDGFNAKYDEIFGKGAADAMWVSWQQATVGQECEIWEYQEDLSGLPPLIKAAERK
jgi:hypothetical protein